MKTPSGRLLIVAFCALVCSANAQEIISIDNPSFEGEPHAGMFGGKIDTPGWFDCGQIDTPGESPPDLHPVTPPAWGVTMKAADGLTYLGLVTRYNGTFEAVSQKLKTNIKAGKCYAFSVQLALSPTYYSITRRSGGKPESFSNPVSFHVFGAGQHCEGWQLLAEQENVSNHEWQLFDFSFKAEYDMSFITIEAYYNKDSDGTVTPYNGNIMVDGFSPFREIECGE